MPDPTYSLLATTLRPAFSAAIRHASRLHEERSATHTAFNANLLNHTISDTFNRLTGGNITDNWWRTLLAVVGHKYIAPDFLKVSAVQDWLRQDIVETYFRVLAAEVIMGVSADRTEERERLAQEYSNFTGEHHRRANGPIDVVIGVLVAGYLASIPSNQRPLAGMLQQIHGTFNERLDDLEEKHIAGVTDLVTERFPIVRQLLTPYAENELADILSLRSLDQIIARHRIHQLFKRVSDGDLSPIDETVKHQIFEWTARLCATEKETLPLAKEIRVLLAKSAPNWNLSIIDALISEADGDMDGALRGLRDAEEREARSVWFGILIRAKGEERALDWFDGEKVISYEAFFSGPGWVSWAITSAKRGRWKETAEVLKDLQPMWDETPALPIVEGSVNAAFLLPGDFRSRVLDGVPLYHSMTPISGPDAVDHHNRALECFGYAENTLRGRVREEWSTFFADWALWLQLMDPDVGRRNAAREKVGAEMANGKKALGLVPFAHSFEINYDPRPLKAYLENRRELGGLDDRAGVAEFIVNSQLLEAKKFRDYFEKNSDELTRFVPAEFFASRHVESILEDEGSSQDARSAIERHRASLDEDHAKRLEMMIDAHEGLDVRKDLEELYQTTDKLIDLRNLIEFLKRRGDREALRPLCLELFRRLPTEDGAIDVVASLSGPPSFDHEQISSFLNDNEHLLENSQRLLDIKSMALTHAGRYVEAGETNERSRRGRVTPENVRIGVNIAIASGNWEAVGGMVAEAWALREEHDASELVALAHLAGQQSQTREQGLQLLKLAAERAPNDAAVLAAVYWQHFQFGHDEEADARWLSRAMELSTDAGGPIWGMSLPDIVENWLPKRRNHLIEVERKWVQGEIPISVVADSFNVSLTRMLVHLPSKSAEEPDGRRRMVLPVIAADRPETEIDEDWTVGIDVTSVLVLQYLGILDSALDAFGHSKFSPDIFEHLYRERTDARFHQPSRISSAKRVLRLQGEKCIEIIDLKQTPPKSLVEEVGRETADVLQWTRNVEGITVCVRPIYTVGSLMRSDANLGEFNAVTISLTSFSKWLIETGQIGSDVYARICTVLRNSGDAEDPSVPEGLAEKRICFDGLALTYLNDAKALQAVVSALGVINVHSNIFHEMRLLAEQEDSEDEIVSSIDAIRQTIRSRVQDGKASFLPRPTKQFPKETVQSFRLESTASLLEGTTECQAVCIDDRFLNSHSTFIGPDKKAKPILSVLDTIRYLVELERLTQEDCYRLRHRLRAGGFAFVPLDPEEVCHWIRATRIQHGQTVETVELRVLRQTAARGDSLALTNWNQAFALAANARAACTSAISEMWGDTDLAPQTVMAHAGWIWQNLMATAVPGHQVLDMEDYRRLVSEVVSLRIGSLLLPLPSRSRARQEDYAYWIEHTVLQHLRPANADRIRGALVNSKDAITSLEVSQAAYGNLFLEQLPEKARAMMIRDDPEFAEKCGYRAERVFSIGQELQVVDRDLFVAAAEALGEEGESTTTDLTGKEIQVEYDQEAQYIRLRWFNSGGAKQEAVMPDLCLLSPSAAVRFATLEEIKDRLGPTFDPGDDLEQEISSDRQEFGIISRVFDESSNGVAAVQANMAGKILGGKQMGLSDFVPESKEYFERFVAPLTVDRDTRSFLRDVLPQYRQDLVARNLKEGLHICCLGAVHDDLSPGKWLSEKADDCVWSALQGASSGFNPFSLLGALDVALYRQHDQRFQTFAAKAVEQLLHGNFGFTEEVDVYRLLHITVDFVLNRINLLEGGATKPGYWKRLAAWMQAGYVVETMLRSQYTVSLDQLEEWTHQSMAAAGAYASLIDAKEEPMLFAARMMPGRIRYEVLGRLEVLRRRHETDGREVPGSDLIDRQLEELEKGGLIPALWFPGPLEGDRRPTAATPANIEGEIERVAKEGNGDAVSFLVTISQLYLLNDRQIELARLAVVRACDEAAEKDVTGVVQVLEQASFVAAASRNTALCASIGDAMVRISPLLSEGAAESIPRILLQAAAAFQEEHEWFSWLDEKLVEVVEQLPSHPNASLRTFLGHLEEIEIILPTERWFHARAKSAALVGAV